MPFKPDDPFPKTQGNSIRSKDWNDLIYEVQRLDTAKLKNSTDNFTGTLSISEALRVSGSVGIGTNAPGAKLTVQKDSTNSAPAANGKALFVSGLFNDGKKYDGGIEFRHDNLTQGVGFGFNTIYASGGNANQELNIMSRGTSPLNLNTLGGSYVTIGSNPLDIASKHLGLLNNVTNRAEIANDIETYKTLMILGNRSGDGKTRSVSIWDVLNVNGSLNVNGPLKATGDAEIQGGKLKLGSFGGGFPGWINYANSKGFFTGAGSDNAYFGMRNRKGEAGTDNEFDTVLYWGDDTDDHLIFESQDSGEVMRVTGFGSLGIGAAAPSRRLHVHSDTWNNNLGAEIHTSGATAGFSFMNREAGRTWDEGKAGQRWVLYADGNIARLWTSGVGNVWNIDTAGQLLQPGWQDAALTPGIWVNYGSGYNNAQFYKDHMSIVHLRGLIRTLLPTVGRDTLMFTLPEGYRPANRQLHVIQQNETVGRVDILPDGRVLAMTVAGGWWSLDSISFRAER